MGRKVGVSHKGAFGNEICVNFALQIRGKREYLDLWERYRFHKGYFVIFCLAFCAQIHEFCGLANPTGEVIFKNVEEVDLRSPSL